MALSNVLDPMERHTFNTASLTGSYQKVYQGGFPKDCVKYKIYNSSSSVIDISYDGVTSHDVIPPSGTYVLDVTALGEKYVAWPAGRELWVKGNSSSGTLYEMGLTIRKDR